MKASLLLCSHYSQVKFPHLGMFKEHFTNTYLDESSLFGLLPSSVLMSQQLLVTIHKSNTAVFSLIGSICLWQSSFCSTCCLNFKNISFVNWRLNSPSLQYTQLQAKFQKAKTANSFSVSGKMHYLCWLNVWHFCPPQVLYLWITRCWTYSCDKKVHIVQNHKALYSLSSRFSRLFYFL